MGSGQVWKEINTGTQHNPTSFLLVGKSCSTEDNEEGKAETIATSSSLENLEKLSDTKINLSKGKKVLNSDNKSDN